MEIDVDSAAERYPESAAPAYPPDMMLLGIEGYVAVRFVVDTNGLIDLSTVRITEQSRPEFAAAVREALPAMRFRPARRGADLRPVRQLAEQLFRFQIKTATPPVTPAKPPVKPPSKLPARRPADSSIPLDLGWLSVSRASAA
jgi:TonB family protein